jgi:thiol-disulfide isomerase/thioredoxin
MPRAMLRLGWVPLSFGLAACVALTSPKKLDFDESVTRGLAPSSGVGSPLAFKVERWPDGGTYELAQDRGAVVLLDVWATWCEPCRASLPWYETLWKRYSSQGFHLYAVSVDADRSVIGPFVNELNLTLPVLHDSEARVSERVLRVKQVPTSVLVDRGGVVRRIHEGLSDALQSQLATEIEALLAEPQ